MAYVNPTLPTLRLRLLRDLRDPDGETFGDTELNDYINGGIAELNELRPLETRETLTDPTQLTADLDFEYIYRVAINDNLYAGSSGTRAEYVVPPNNDETNEQNGWAFFANKLRLPGPIRDRLIDDWNAPTSHLELRVDGYIFRDPMTQDYNVAQFQNYTDELAVRQYGRWRGWDALRNDRALFQQWQTQSNNSDTSPTQLTNMAQASEAEWARTRHRIYAIRRPAVGW